VLLAGENDQRPYDPFGDDDDIAVTSSSADPTPVTKTLATTSAPVTTVSLTLRDDDVV